jgi:glyoxylase-like metal-dependent hydrolase (beta-lactamase superfamily II)
MNHELGKGCYAATDRQGRSNVVRLPEADLRWDVLVKQRPGLTPDVPPGNESLMWVANSSTLISGKRDAVLVDTFLTVDQSNALANWVAASGKNLTTIYITHAHGDHSFGLKILLDRFPHSKAFATPEVVKAMARQVSPEYLESFWKSRFPGQIPDPIVLPDELSASEIDLEGQALIPVRLGHTDTDDSTCLHVPSIGLVVAGDAVYNGIHLFQGETNSKNRPQWIAALDKIDALKPRAVVAGHKVPANDDNPKTIEETRTYLRDFTRLDEQTTSARELYDEMLALYPDRANPGSLWGAALAAKA